MSFRIKSYLSAWPYLVITCVALVSHGLLLLNDGLYWDGWLIKDYLDNNDWDSLHAMTSEMGLPVLGYFFWSLKLLGIHQYYKVVAFLSMLLSAVLVYRIGLLFGWLNRIESLGVALLSLVYPAYQMTVEICTLQYVFFYCVFLLAALLMLLHLSFSGVSSFIIRAMSLLLFFLSFTVNSLLVFYFPFVMLLFLRIKQLQGLSWQTLLKKIPIRLSDFLILPFLFWGLKLLLTPKHGLYKGYNNLDLNYASVVSHIRDSIVTTTDAQISLAQKGVGVMGHLLLWIFILVGVYVCYSKCIRHEKPAQVMPEILEREFVKTNWIFAFGVVLLLSGVFPYAAAGLTAEIAGVDSRHALLVGLPMAIILVSVLRYLRFAPGFTDASEMTARRLTAILAGTALVVAFLAYLGSRHLLVKLPMVIILLSVLRYLRFVPGYTDESGMAARRLTGILAGTTLVVAFGLSTIDYYVGWQARAIKDRAIMAVLAKVDRLKPFSVFWIDDQFPAGKQLAYDFYEWSTMFKKIWGGESRIGLQTPRYSESDLNRLRLVWNHRYNLSEFDPRGAQIRLTITPGGHDLSDGQLVRQYLLHRILAFLKGSELSDASLYEVVHIHVHMTLSKHEDCPVPLASDSIFEAAHSVRVENNCPVSFD